MSKIDILDVRVDKITSTEVLKKIGEFLKSNDQHYFVTVNLEMFVRSQEDKEFLRILNNSDINITDGMGFSWAAKFISGVSLERIAGVDLIYKICEADFIKDKKIYLMGAGEGIAKKAANILEKKYSDLNIVGAEEGIYFKIPNSKFQIPNKSQNPKSKKDTTSDNEFYKLNRNLIEKINNTKPDLLFVAFGSPKQEKWIAENLKKMPSVKLAIGIGGAFDFIAGEVRRAPKFMQKLGLEWLWRLILQPWRIKRIYKATAGFGWMVFKSKIKQ